MKKVLFLLCFLPAFMTHAFNLTRSNVVKIMAEGDLTSMDISDDADNIIVTLEASVITASYQVFINMDNEVNTGFTDGTWNDMGADYLIESGSIYKYNGIAGGWGWTFVGATTGSDMAISGGTQRTIEISRTLITAPSVESGDQIFVGYKSIDGSVSNYLPDTPLMQAHFIASDPRLISLNITNDIDNLYVTIKGTSIDAAWDLLIDSDDNGSTGYNQSIFGTSSGADFLMQQWTGFFTYSGTGGGWGWTQDGAAAITTSTNEIIIEIPLSKLGTLGNNVSVGFIGSSGDRLPAIGSFQSYAFDTFIWNGTAWDDGTPGASKNVRIDNDYNAGSLTTANLTILAGATLTVSSGETLLVSGDLLIEGNLIVESGGSLLTYETNSILGRAIIFNRNTRYADGKYSFVGTPVLQYPTITGADLGTYVYKYNETNPYDGDAGLSRWEDASADQLIPGVGYTQAFQQPLTFVGKPNSGTITVSGLSHTIPVVGTTVEAQRGWNLISNPYPAAIDVTSFIADNINIDGSVYLWDDHGSDTGRGNNGDYATVNAIGTISGPNNGSFGGYIGSSQGFLVRVSNEIANTSVVFNELQRVTGDNTDATFFRQVEQEHSSVKLALNGDFYNETLIGFREDATIGYDRLYDAKKLIGNENIAFYSILEGEKYSIQGLPLLRDTQKIEIGYDLKQGGTYSLSLIETNNLPEQFDVVLVNTRTLEEFYLDLNESVELELAAGSNLNHLRLDLRASSTLGSLQNLASSLNVYISDNLLNIEVGDDSFQKSNITVYDLSGSLIFTLEDQVFDKKRWSSKVNLAENRIYIVSIDNGVQSLTKKFIK